MKNSTILALCSILLFVLSFMDKDYEIAGFILGWIILCSSIIVEELEKLNNNRNDKYKKL
jgi:hypothetical protein